MNNKNWIWWSIGAVLSTAVITVLLVGMLTGQWPWARSNVYEYNGMPNRPKETTTQTQDTTVPEDTTPTYSDETQSTTSPTIETEATEPITGTGSTKPTTGTGSTKPTTGTDSTKPTTGTDSTKPTTGTDSTKPTTGNKEDIDFDDLIGEDDKIPGSTTEATTPEDELPEDTTATTTPDTDQEGGGEAKPEVDDIDVPIN